jgi:hypothetical protein
MSTTILQRPSETGLDTAQSADARLGFNFRQRNDAVSQEPTDYLKVKRRRR